ncbi:MAG: HlyD family type I secretion periplasmic adaptor subunit, partial [Hyphococcus sp.]
MSTERQAPIDTPESVGERHTLALPIELEEGAPPYLPRAILAVVSGLVLVLLVWANIAQVRELSVALGEIAPYGSTRDVAHLEGGIVDEVLVAPGDIVEADTPLVRLKTASEGGEYDRFSVRRANLLLRTERLSAQAENRVPDFTEFEQTWPSLVSEQMAIYASSEEQHDAALDVLRSREDAASSEVEKADAEYKAQKELHEYAKQQLSIQEELIEDGFTSRRAYLEAKAAVSSTRADAAAAKARFEQAQRAHAGAVAERMGAEAQYRNSAAEERAQAVAELAELAEPIQSLQDRADRLTIRAPIAGQVKNITVNGEGDVVRPGGLVAEITPTGDTLFAEVRVEPKDIGHVQIGQETVVSVTTFDPNRYGKLDGKIAHISADSFVDERTGDNYYVAYVALDSQSIGKGRLE